MAMKRILTAALIVTGAFHLASCGRRTQPGATAETYLAAFVDTTVSPRVDFFQYAVGKWLKDHPIPASERSWGIGRAVQENTYQQLIAINEEAAQATGAKRDANAQRIGDFWFAAMDTATIEKQGFEPLKDEFARIAAVKTTDELLQTIGHLQWIGVGAMCAQYIFQDEKNSERFALHLYQGGLGLPDRDYYFDTDERARMLRREYVTHVARMFELLGDDPTKAKASAAAVMALETELAGGSRKLADLRDLHANYNPMALAELPKLSPTIRWREFLEAGHVTNVDTVIVGQPEFFRQVDTSLRARSLDDWKTYLRWQLATTFAAQAGGRYDAENFRFYGTILNGTPEQRPRWKRMLDQEENYLGDALGQLYVAKHFSPATKERYVRLTDEIFAAFDERLEHLEWMSDSTRARARRKLATVTKKVGYPERWRDYSTYRVTRDSFLGNCVRGNQWLSDFYIAKLHEPVDRLEWVMTPQTYNAYYNPSNNEIVLPAAVFLLPGIDDAKLDDAIVYSYAGGTTIGHEITHGFDDQGRQFDEKGNLVSWWTPQDEKEFKKRADRIVDQFDGYVVLDSMRVNGRATQGENIADLGGMLLGWEAFKKTAQYQKAEPLGGFTPEQRYFIGWALGWMNAMRPENLAVRVKTDVHAPSFLRVNGPVVNLPEFQKAFGVQPGDPMYRPDSLRVAIW
jgi:putative endopeptidase